MHDGGVCFDSSKDFYLFDGSVDGKRFLREINRDCLKKSPVYMITKAMRATMNGGSCGPSYCRLKLIKTYLIGGVFDMQFPRNYILQFIPFTVVVTYEFKDFIIPNQRHDNKSFWLRPAELS